ncbi:hypothetical protein HBH1_02074 [Herbaspirillum sp. BH-1]|uniref:SHOCT domain-containing protein n=1 Tax=Herbaspirillum sp. (strain BH-1) TaxID=2058884 RepID=UPI000C887986|nr:SHOCT domain-containing protein [Herbaspirillum sp. BH-1]PLY59564.1 hypothetical protein HBH1_02074 [Herbaspirillum sp. BH-1]
MEVFGIIVVLVIVSAVWGAIKKQRELDAAKQAYHQSLEQLKQKPADPELRQSTLAKGRHYSNLTRDKKGVTMFDEVALMNDINAACAGASAFQTRESASQGPSIEDRLKRLSGLHSSGAITDEEYSCRRATILSEV